MKTYEQIQQETIRLCERIRYEEDRISDMDRVLREIEKNENGNFVFMCVHCEKQFETKNYADCFCSVECKKLYEIDQLDEEYFD